MANNGAGSDFILQIVREELSKRDPTASISSALPVLAFVLLLIVQQWLNFTHKREEREHYYRSRSRDRR